MRHDGSPLARAEQWIPDHFAPRAVRNDAVLNSRLRANDD
jgi:hypothetical protein